MTDYEILLTDEFERDVKRLSKKYPSLKSDLHTLNESLKFNPKQGDPLGKDCYKVRLLIRSKGKGKSGGGRVITTVLVTKQRVYLLALYDKSEVATLTDNQLSERLIAIDESDKLV